LRRAKFGGVEPWPRPSRRSQGIISWTKGSSQSSTAKPSVFHGRGTYISGNILPTPSIQIWDIREVPHARSTAGSAGGRKTPPQAAKCPQFNQTVGSTHLPGMGRRENGPKVVSPHPVLAQTLPVGTGYPPAHIMNPQNTTAEVLLGPTKPDRQGPTWANHKNAEPPWVSDNIGMGFVLPSLKGDGSRHRTHSGTTTPPATQPNYLWRRTTRQGEQPNKPSSAPKKRQRGNPPTPHSQPSPRHSQQQLPPHSDDTFTKRTIAAKTHFSC